MTDSTDDLQLETLVITREGRRTLGEMAAAEGLGAVVSEHLALLDMSEEWRWDIESARLAKLREMAQKDTDASRLLEDADKKMRRTIGSQFQPQGTPQIVSSQHFCASESDYSSPGF